MVDISTKKSTKRIATAVGTVFMSKSTLHLIETSQMKKGSIWEVARLAGIMAAKKTPELIPMCHPILLGNIDVDFSVLDTKDGKSAEIKITASVTAAGQTGVEMEAMTAVCVAALTLYDMCKAADKGISFGEIALNFKSGGKSGTYIRKAKP